MKRVGDCPLCQCEMWLPDKLFLEGMERRSLFFCSYGHKQKFSENTIQNYYRTKKSPEITEYANVIPFKKNMQRTVNEKEQHP